VDCFAFAKITAEPYGRKGQVDEQKARHAMSQVFRAWSVVVIDEEALAVRRIEAELKVLQDFSAIGKHANSKERAARYDADRSAYCVKIFSQHDSEMQRRVAEFVQAIRNGRGGS
jgi:hypothetical protein